MRPSALPAARRDRPLPRLLAAAFALVVACGLAAAAPPPVAAQEEAAVAVVELRTEHATNPLGIDVAEPRLSWRLASQARAEAQTAYQVQVASSGEALADGDADVWDSGRVEGETPQAVYAGPPLDSRERVHWRVRVWDADGTASAWSEPAWWEMGLLDSADWDARWIGREAPEDPSFDDFALTVELTPLNAAFGVFFRADGGGNSYMWQLIGLGANAPLLRTHVFENGGVRVLDNVPLGDVVTAEDFFDQRHTLTIEAEGDEIRTLLDGELVDAVTDDTHAAGGIGFRANRSDVDGSAEAAVVHAVTVSADGDVVFVDDFADDTGRWTSGTYTDDGLEVTGVTESWLVAADATAAPLLRRDFDVDGEVERARLYVSGLAYADVFLNGERVGDARLDPAFVDYDERALYVTHDVTDLLQDGANTVGAELGRGFYGMTSPSVWNWHVAGWHDDPKLLLQLEVEHVDGTTTTVTSDGSWQSDDGPVLSDSLLSGETHDARREQPGWNAPGFDASGWDAADLVDDPGVPLEAQMVEPIEVTDVLEAVSVTEPQPGTYVFDVGQNIAGWAALDVEGPAGTEVVLQYGEKLLPDGTVDNRDVLNHVTEPYQTDRYVLRGDGPETFRSRFSYKGFQFVQVDGLPAAPDVGDLRGEAVHTAVEDIGGFASGNPLFDEIHRATRWAILNNLHGQPTDTPMYEKAGWTADGQVMVDASTHNFDMARVYTKWMDDMRDGQIANGRIPVIAPTHGWGSDWVAPEWSATYVLLAWEMYQRYGDERVLADHYAAMRDYVDHELARLDGDGLSTSQLGDWAAPGYSQGPAPEGGALTSTAFVHRAADLLGEIAGVIGRDDDAAAYAAAAEQVADDFNAAFLDVESGVYSTGVDVGYRQTSNVLPLAWDLVPAEHVDAVVDNLVADVHAHDEHLSTGVIGTKHLLRVLTEHGHADLADTIANQTTYPSWGLWFENGATTPFEFWELESRSRGHMFLGTVLDWFYADVAGLRVERIGAEATMEVRPHLVGDLDHASAWTETVRGEAASAWRRDADGVVELDVTVPVGVTATVHVPADGPWQITEAGTPVAEVDGVLDVADGDGSVVLTLGSGSYAFASDPSLTEPQPPACPEPDPSATVVVGDVDSGVPNREVGDGCTVEDLLDDEAEWGSRGALVRHVSEVLGDLQRDGLLTARERAAVVRAAVRAGGPGRR